MTRIDLWKPFVDRATRELGRPVTVSPTFMDPNTGVPYKHLTVEGLKRPMRWDIEQGAALLAEGKTEIDVLDELLTRLKSHAGVA